jgi:hypothetical protein
MGSNFRWDFISGTVEAKPNSAEAVNLIVLFFFGIGSNLSARETIVSVPNKF